MKGGLVIVFFLSISVINAQVGYLYTNNKVNPNTVSIFSVDEGGELALLDQVETGGGSRIGGFYAAPRIVSSGQCLFVSHDGTDDVSALRINLDGSLELVDRQRTGGVLTDGIAVTPNGRFLYAANSFSDDITTFRVENCRLTRVGSLVSARPRPNDIKVLPNSNCLAVSLGGANSVDVFAINPDTGGLTRVAGSPFRGSEGGSITGIEFNNPSGTVLYGVKGFGGVGRPVVDIFDIISTDTCQLELRGTFIEDRPDNSSVIKLNPDGGCLFITHWRSGGITVLRVDPKTGDLELVEGSPFRSEMIEPAGMDFSSDGSLLFVANGPLLGPGQVNVFAVDGCIPTEIASYSTGENTTNPMNGVLFRSN